MENPTHAPAGPIESSRHLRVAAAVVWRDGELLLTQRPPGGDLGLLWEFPGGKIEPGETPEHALIREIREELGVGARPLNTIAVHRHEYPGELRVEIAFVRCELDTLDFVPSEAVYSVRWIRPRDVDLGELLAGDREFMKSLAAAPGADRA